MNESQIFTVLALAFGVILFVFMITRNKDNTEEDDDFLLFWIFFLDDDNSEN